MEICVQNLSFGYIKKPFCLKGVNVLIKDGDTVALMGGEAMGKSSFLKLLSKLERQYIGFIKFDGKDINELDDGEIKISYLPSEPVFFGSKTLKYNLDYLFSVEKMEPFSNEKILKIFKDFSFEKSLFDKVKSLSLYEKRLFAIIRSYIKNPSVVLIDEQTEGLSSEHIEKIKNAIMMLINGKNDTKTTIIACNNANMLDLCNKYLCFSYGGVSMQNNLNDIQKDFNDLFFTEYFNVSKKSFLLSKEEDNYYLNDYKIEYKNPKKQTGEYTTILSKIKLSNIFNSALCKTQIGFDELIKVVLVDKDGEDIICEDRVLNEYLNNSGRKYHLFEEATGVKII